MKIFTNRPIIEKYSGGDGLETLSSGKVDSYAGKQQLATKTDTRTSKQKQKDSAKQKRKEDRQSRQTARKDFRNEKKSLNEKLRSGEITKEQYQAQLEIARKAKKNATQVKFLKSFRPNRSKDTMVYKLQKLINKGGKWFKKYPDGTEQEVKKENVATVNGSAVDKAEISKATGLSETSIPNAITPNDNSSLGSKITTTKDDAQGNPIEQEKNLPTNDISVVVPQGQITQDDLNGGYYLNQDIQPANETQEDVKDDDKKMKTSTKILIGAGIFVGLTIIGFGIYSLVKKKA